jgi:hypothetical protein
MPAPKLHYGPYKTPRFKIGATINCEVRGDVEIVRISDGRIPWPLGKPKGQRAVTLHYQFSTTQRMAGFTSSYQPLRPRGER